MSLTHWSLNKMCRDCLQKTAVTHLNLVIEQDVLYVLLKLLAEDSEMLPTFYLL